LLFVICYLLFVICYLEFVIWCLVLIWDLVIFFTSIWIIFGGYPFSEKDLEKILVIQTAFIGDAILTLPMIQKLKEMYPDCEIDVIAIPSTRLIFSSSPSVNTVLILDKRGVQKNFINFVGFCRKIKQNKYTRIYSPHRSFRSSLIVLFSGVTETYGFTRNSLKQVYKHLIEYKSSHHEVQRNISLTGEDTSGDKWKILPEIRITEETKNTADRFINELKTSGEIIALSPGSVWNTKKYPFEYHSQVIEQLTNLNYFVILVGGNEDSELCKKLAESVSNKNIISSAGKFSIVESVELLKRCCLLISNDSAPAHMGVCAGIPVLTLYCSTVAGFGFYPYNPGSAWVSFDDLFCKPCGIHGYDECPIKTFDCGFKLKPEHVVNKVKEMLNEN
jgi:heptosyltransferase-2